MEGEEGIGILLNIIFTVSIQSSIKKKIKKILLFKS